MSYNSWFGGLDDAGGPCLRLGILILTWLWSLVFDAPIFQILALNINFEAAKNIYVC